MSSEKFTMDKENKNTTETHEEKLFCQHYYHDFLMQWKLAKNGLDKGYYLLITSKKKYSIWCPVFINIQELKITGSKDNMTSRK